MMTKTNIPAVCHLAKQLPSKISLSADQTTLIITDVCKACSDGTSDLMVIACNVSNQYGYAFGEGYVNVLRKLLVVEGRYMYSDISLVSPFTISFHMGILNEH